MNCKVKVFFDSERRPSYDGVMSLDSILKQYVSSFAHDKIRMEVGRHGKINFLDRGTCTRVILHKAGMKHSRSYQPLIAVLDGVVTMPQIRVAAVDALKTPEGKHRTIVLIRANGLEYRFKCNHKHHQFSGSLDRLELLSKRAV